MAAASKANPVLIIMAISGAVDAVAAMAGFTDQVSATVAWWILAGNLAVKVGFAIYLRGAVVPFSSVAARATPGGELVAGPAAPPGIEPESAVRVRDAATSLG